MRTLSTFDRLAPLTRDLPLHQPIAIAIRALKQTLCHAAGPSPKRRIGSAKLNDIVGGLNRAVKTVFLVCLWALNSPARGVEAVSVYAAASTTEVISAVAAGFQHRTGITVKTSFASSSTLAKQIEAGAPANVFISASPEWMDFVEEKALVEPGSRRELLGNELAMIAPKGAGFQVDMTSAVPPAGLNGKLCMGDPAHVPAGIYGKEALTSLGWWNALEKRLVGTNDVRAALAFVERGECAAGIVYASDAKSNERVEIVAAFPPNTHSDVRYPVALLKPAGEAAQSFLNYLFGETARTFYVHHGFTVPAQ